MTKYTVYIEALEIKNVTEEELEELKNNEEFRNFKFNGVMSRGMCDPVQPNTTKVFDSKEEAMAEYKRIKETETSRYYWGNELVNLRRVCIEECEWDEEDETLEPSGCYDYEYLEIN